MGGSAIIALVVATAAFTASAADYNWTGNGDGHSWSDANNWTNATGAVVAPANVSNKAFTYLFPVADSGLVVTQDISGYIIIKSLEFERTSTAPVMVEMVSKAVGCRLGFSANSTNNVPEGMTLYWKADADRWINTDINKYGLGKMVIDLIKSPQTQRGLNVYAGTVEVAATSADTRARLPSAPPWESRRLGGSTMADMLLPSAAKMAAVHGMPRRRLSVPLVPHERRVKGSPAKAAVREGTDVTDTATNYQLPSTNFKHFKL